MRRRHLLLAGLSALLAGRAQARAPALQSADALVDRFIAASQVERLGVSVMRGEKTLYLRYAGGYGPDTRLPIASASKWLAGALVMSLVDDGLLALDAPIGRYLPELPAGYAAIRLDQLLSFTAGLEGLRAMTELRQPAGITLLASALSAAKAPLAAPPGTRFDYGGANLQLVGAAVERAAGQSWSEAFDARIARPLGMDATLWGRVREPPARTAAVANPVIQGGAWSSLPDYGAFLTMIAQAGTFRGRRVLSAAAVAAMGRVMTRGLPRGPIAAADGAGAEYLLAHWCERFVADRCVLESSPGAFGTNPWIDHGSGLHGVIFLQDQRRRIAAAQTALRDGLIETFATRSYQS